MLRHGRIVRIRKGAFRHINEDRRTRTPASGALGSGRYNHRCTGHELPAPNQRRRRAHRASSRRNSARRIGVSSPVGCAPRARRVRQRERGYTTSLKQVACKFIKTLAKMSSFNLKQHEIAVEEIHRNLAPSALYEHAIHYEKDAHIAENGSLVAYSGVKTGRSPKDKRVVKQSPSENDVWWGPVNIPIEPKTFAINRERARDYLNSRERLYCVDGYAGWDPGYRIKVRVICSRPYHALFMRTMLIRPTKKELEEFGSPDIVIYNAGAFPANSLTAGMGSKTSIDLSLEDKELLILGSEYAGEMKKGVFTVVTYIAPKRGVL